jgi:hypothetical protein
MRVATYSIPPSSAGSETGECAVFYFGKSEGGDVEANMKRWIGQFEASGDPVRTSQSVDGMNVSMIDLSGTYLASAGPMMAAGERKEGYRLLGAIVEAPDGSVFFKLTGPEETIRSGEGEFETLVQSFEKE